MTTLQANSQALGEVRLLHKIRSLDAEQIFDTLIEEDDEQPTS